MPQDSLLNPGIIIPKELEKWVIGYQNIDRHEFDFYLNNFPISRVRIKASKVKKTQKFFAEPNYKLKYNGSENRYTIPHGVDDDAIEAIFICLSNFISKGKVFGFQNNSAYPGTPVL